MWTSKNHALGDQDAEQTTIPKKVELEKVVVLSFRASQLQRIADLQDELLDLVYQAQIHSEATSRQSINGDIDRGLRDYGMYYHIWKDLA